MSHYLAAISTDDELCVSHYKLLNTISQGTFAKVQVAQHILTDWDKGGCQSHQSGLLQIYLGLPLHEGSKPPKYYKVI